MQKRYEFVKKQKRENDLCFLTRHLAVGETCLSKKKCRFAALSIIDKVAKIVDCLVLYENHLAQYNLTELMTTNNEIYIIR